MGDVKDIVFLVCAIFGALLLCFAMFWCVLELDDKIRIMLLGKKRARKAISLLREHVRNGGEID